MKKKWSIKKSAIAAIIAIWIALLQFQMANADEAVGAYADNSINVKENTTIVVCAAGRNNVKSYGEEGAYADISEAYKNGPQPAIDDGKWIESSRLVATGRSKDGSGCYLVYDGDHPAIRVENPSERFAIEYSFRKMPLSKPAETWPDTLTLETEEPNLYRAVDLEIRVYRLDTMEFLYSVSVEEDANIEDGYGIVCRNDQVHLSIFSLMGEEYLEISDLIHLQDGSLVDSSLYLQLSTGQFTGQLPDSDHPLSVAQQIIAANRNIRKSAVFSTLYSNLLEQNGYQDVWAHSGRDGFAISFTCPQATISQFLSDYFAFPNSMCALRKEPFAGTSHSFDKETLYVQLVLSHSDDPAYLATILFGGEDAIRWENVVIYPKASRDGKQHEIGSIADFYRWYAFSADGRKLAWRKYGGIIHVNVTSI